MQHKQSKLINSTYEVKIITFRFEKYLIDLFKHLNNVWASIEGKMKSEAFKVRLIGINYIKSTDKNYFNLEKNYNLFKSLARFSYLSDGLLISITKYIYGIC